jgi:uncharacterized membrane protein YkvA (DUF1232 family)
MSLGTALLLAGAVTLGAYVAVIAVLLVLGRGRQVRALAGFVPDCVVLVGRLATDPLTPRRHKIALAALAAYLAFPFDLVPDFIPVAGQLDDLVAIALVLRLLLRSRGAAAVEAHWPGPPGSLALVLRAAGLRAT